MPAHLAICSLRWAEFALLYLGMPLVICFCLPSKLLLPTLWVASAVVLVILSRYYPADCPRLDLSASGRHLVKVLLRFLCAALLLTVMLWHHDPNSLLRILRHNPTLWSVIMVAYPLLSVLPQGVIYRRFYQARYAPLFGTHQRLSLVIGAAVFSLAHLTFRNHWALLFTFIGGLMFLSTYRTTRRSTMANIEHALYGDFIFTIGWGKYLYHGTQALAEAATTM